MLGGGTLWQLRQALAAAESEIEGGAQPARLALRRPARRGRPAAARGLRACRWPTARRSTSNMPSALALMRDLRAMGESNAGGRAPPRLQRGAPRCCAPPRSTASASRQPSGRVAASFEVLFLHGWAPHASQPKPLRPGSAAHRLAEALGTTEIERRRERRRQDLIVKLVLRRGPVARASASSSPVSGCSSTW